jgi:hypothetical protein
MFGAGSVGRRGWRRMQKRKADHRPRHLRFVLPAAIAAGAARHFGSK